MHKMEETLLDPATMMRQIDEAVAFIRAQFVDTQSAYQTPQFAIVCGSGLGRLGARLREARSIPYAAIPNFPVSTVSGHKGELAFGLLHGVPTVCMIGRFHYYEGYSLARVTFPIRVFARLGVKTLLVTNAAGGLDPALQIGDVMAIEDHISLPHMGGLCVLRGPNLDDFGTRFPALTHVYQRNTHELLCRAAEDVNLPTDFIRKGIYCAGGGPCYETPAEVRFLRMIGASAVGMSTVPEVTVAVHSGIERILAFSLISNRCVAHHDEDIVAPTHAEVLEETAKRVQHLEALVERLAGLLFPSE